MTSEEIRAILDLDGNIKSTHDFEPFGVELQPLSDESTNLKYKYTGQERDNYTNLDYMHFRYYASAMGRFLKPDNIIPNPANPQSWNLYSYVNSNPVNFNDPSGHYGNVPLGMKQTRLAPPGGSIWDMAMNSTYTESIGGWYVSYSDWATTSDNAYAESTEKVAQFRLSDMTSEEYLGSIGVPESQICDILDQLEILALSVSPKHEMLVAIVESKETGNYSVMARSTKDLMPTVGEEIAFRGTVFALGNNIVAWGHAHTPVGTWRGTLEGPSETDRREYFDKWRQWNKAYQNQTGMTLNPNRFFVLTQENLYYFDNPYGGINFRQIPWY
jgi:RHS repeat-associated protein